MKVEKLPTVRNYKLSFHVCTVRQFNRISNNLYGTLYILHYKLRMFIPVLKEKKKNCCHTILWRQHEIGNDVHAGKIAIAEVVHFE